MSQQQGSAAGEAETVPSGVVLVVEDEALVRVLVVQTLEEAGYQVREAAEARAAMAALDEGGDIALMVTDVGLPGMNGKELAQQARGRRPDLKILFMTGYADGVIEQDLPPGADLINKPFDLDLLAAKAEALLRI